MSAIHLPPAPQVFPDLIVDPVGDAVILLHPREARWALTNQTGLDMARLFDGTRTPADVVAHLAAEYPEILPDDLRADVDAFLRQLHGCHLIANAAYPHQDPPPNPHANPTITIYLTEECNLRCKHCAVVEGKMPNPTLTDDDVRTLIREHATKYDNPMIGFLGGEPLLAPSLLDHLGYARQFTNRVQISTNGLLLTEDIARRLAELNVRVQLSLEGASPETHDLIRGKGTFEKAWAALQLLVRHLPPKNVIVATTLTSCVLDEIDELVRRCDELAIGKLRFLPLNKIKAARTHWDRIAPDFDTMRRVTRHLIFDVPRRSNPVTEVAGGFPGYVPDAPPTGAHWCPLGRTFIIDSQGEVYNCPALTVGDAHIGNVKRDSLTALSENPTNERARDAVLRRTQLVDDCRTCAWRNFCKGGCSAYMYHQTDSFLINDAHCEFRRNLYREHVLRKVGLEADALALRD